MSDQQTLDKLKAMQFDLMLRDALCWPAHLLGEVLGLPSVDFVPCPFLLPSFETSHMIPNPVAYVPQFTSGLTSNMVIPERMPLKCSFYTAQMCNVLQHQPSQMHHILHFTNLTCSSIDVP